jgi:hypothetical protein
MPRSDPLARQPDSRPASQDMVLADSKRELFAKNENCQTILCAWAVEPAGRIWARESTTGRTVREYPGPCGQHRLWPLGIGEKEDLEGEVSPIVAPQKGSEEIPYFMIS